VHRFFRKDRAVMFDLAAKLDLVATSSDASVLAALEHARAYHAMRRDHIPLPPPAGGEDADSGLAFASGNWRRAVTDRRHPGMVVRRHFEAMVFTYLAEELRTGDIAIAGAGVTLTGAPTCCPGPSASRCWRDSAPGPACPPRRPDSRNGSGMHTWTRPPRWTPATRTTPTW